MPPKKMKSLRKISLPNAKPGDPKAYVGGRMKDGKVEGLSGRTGGKNWFSSGHAKFKSDVSTDKAISRAAKASTPSTTKRNRRTQVEARASYLADGYPASKSDMKAARRDVMKEWKRKK